MSNAGSFRRSTADVELEDGTGQGDHVLHHRHSTELEDAEAGRLMAGQESVGPCQDRIPSPDSAASAGRNEPQAVEKPVSVSWRDLPRKGQLALITITRFSEPLAQSSLQSYMFYQLKWFNPDLSDAVIAGQAGLLAASFTAAQFTTAMLWGRAADSPRLGRKTILMIGLIGTSKSIIEPILAQLPLLTYPQVISCFGFGFATSFWQAMLFRIMGGITNGNIGVLRTMISEIIQEKKYQSRAFLLLPMTWNIGIIFGPIFGGVLSDPAGSYPKMFGDVSFFIKYPYATPNILSGLIMFLAAGSVFLGLEETHECLRGTPDIGIRSRKLLASLIRGQMSTTSTAQYEPLASTPRNSADPIRDLEMSPIATRGVSSNIPADKNPQPRARLAFRKIFIPNVNLTLMSHGLLALHLGTFNSLWYTFLSTPVSDSKIRLPFLFSGGLGLSPATIGLATALIGVTGIGMQLLLYPRVASALGTLRSWRWSLLCFPCAYASIPYLAVVLRVTSSSDGKESGEISMSGLTWVTLAIVLTMQVLGRTFAIPAQTILVNNCTPHSSVLGTVHGLGQSASSLARTLGPVVGGLIYGGGLKAGIVGLVWWILAGFAICGLILSLWVREGTGNEASLDEELEVSGEQVRTPNGPSR
ncbi:hypothetical protein MKZ38_000222 [Zalerion maritima]|uniref:Major facilitator superfamily (MFS) profile domain-containing protein n=1 Tax=Zalerion maritima TaxID=339359 RepID=A0AAD5WS71_9PEZI|nr:hypothetical protein MKZ38_000222 [Zalerion maritima]